MIKRTVFPFVLFPFLFIYVYIYTYGCFLCLLSLFFILKYLQCVYVWDFKFFNGFCLCHNASGKRILFQCVAGLHHAGYHMCDNFNCSHTGFVLELNSVAHALDGQMHCSQQ